jgi:twitching motility protein PilT
LELEKLLRFAVEAHASDLHFQAGSPPMLRIAGQARFIDAAPLTADDTRAIVSQIIPPQYRAEVDERLAHGIDFSYALAGLARFRCSAYSHIGTAACVFRVIPATIPSIEDLHLPSVVHDIALRQRGLTLVTGTTGSGKTTTLAAIIDLINSTLRNKIISIEDPIEYLHQSRKSLISQLEVGTDTPSFDQALHQALRQDPDVILVGELRDVDTLRIALRAADTGHQVFSTVHSATASQTVERIIAMFPPNEHGLLLSQLATSIEAIISQRLLTTRDGKRRPAIEILRGTAVAQKFILENRLVELSDYIATGESGMQTFDQHLLMLFRDHVIGEDQALRWATNPGALMIAMKGIQTGTTLRSVTGAG